MLTFRHLDISGDEPRAESWRTRVWSLSGLARVRLFAAAEKSHERSMTGAGVRLLQYSVRTRQSQPTKANHRAAVHDGT